MGCRTPRLRNDAHATIFQIFGRTNPKFQPDGRYLWRMPEWSTRRGRSASTAVAWPRPPLMIRAFGAHCQEKTWHISCIDHCVPCRKAAAVASAPGGGDEGRERHIIFGVWDACPLARCHLHVRA
jgi:hypothetical protein